MLTDLPPDKVINRYLISKYNYLFLSVGVSRHYTSSYLRTRLAYLPSFIGFSALPIQPVLSSCNASGGRPPTYPRRPVFSFPTGSYCILKQYERFIMATEAALDVRLAGGNCCWRGNCWLSDGSPIDGLIGYFNDQKAFFFP